MVWIGHDRMTTSDLLYYIVWFFYLQSPKRVNETGRHVSVSAWMLYNQDCFSISFICRLRGKCFSPIMKSFAVSGGILFNVITILEASIIAKGQRYHCIRNFNFPYETTIYCMKQCILKCWFIRTIRGIADEITKDMENHRSSAGSNRSNTSNRLHFASRRCAEHLD